MPKQCSFFRLLYIQHGLAAHPGHHHQRHRPRGLSLEDARIQFISGNNDTIPAATEDEINRRIFTLHSAQDIHVPLIPIPIHRTPVDKKITDDDNDFGFGRALRPGPLSTLAGYLFYDIQGLDEPALKHAEIYVKMVHTLDDTQQLFSFTVSVSTNGWPPTPTPLQTHVRCR